MGNRIPVWLGSGLLFCLLFFVGEANAQGNPQTNVDSLEQVVQANLRDHGQVRALYLLYRAFRKRDPEQAVGYLEEAEALAEDIDDQQGMASVWRSYGDYYNSRGEPDKARASLEKAKETFEALGNEEGVISCINGLGNVAVREGNYSLALEHYLAEAEYYEKLGDISGAGTAYQNIGGVHYRQQQFDQALVYIEKSVRADEAMGDSAGLVPALNALSVVYTAKQDYETALKIQYRTLGLSRRYANLYETSSLLNNIGVQYHYLNQLDSARHYYLQALAIYKELDEKQEISTMFINLGELSCQLNQGRQAVAYYDSSMSIALEAGAGEYLSQSYRGLSAAYRLLGDFERALDWNDQYHALRDSLSGERVKLQLNELQTKYEAEQKDRDIAELKKKEAEAASVADQQKAWLAIAISGALLVVLSLVFWIGRNRAREKQKRAELEQKALRSQMNPHFIFNSLGAIQSMYMNGEMDLANNYMGDFGKLMRMILDHSGKEAIPLREDLEMLQLYLDLEKERNQGLIDYAIEVAEEIDPVGHLIPPMVIQPFVENAIWHGILPSRRKGKILIRLQAAEREGYLQVIVEDDGVGMKNEKAKKQHISKGIAITEQRLGQRVQFSQLDPGTRVRIFIPL